jgi:FkbM family methyltransferase
MLSDARASGAKEEGYGFSTRSWRKMAGALFDRRHYKAARNAMLHHKRPIDFLRRYVFGRGGVYPREEKISYRSQTLKLVTYSRHDVLTINEIFFRNDYPISGDETVIVDFGSNIGISAAFFLFFADRSYCYLFEPVPLNVARLKENLKRFESRFTLHEAAVALHDGQAEFGAESTGRYGGIGLKTGHYLTVPCLDSRRVLQDIIAEHGAIDVLKIDIEMLEREILAALPYELLSKIRKIFIEQTFASNPLAATHSHIQYGAVAQFFLRM